MARDLGVTDGMSLKRVIGGARRRSGVMGVALALVASCQAATDKGASPGRETPASAPSTSPPKEEAMTPLDRIDEPNFQLTWTLARAATDGQHGSGELVLVAKSPFKPNQEYPHKFKVRGTNLSIGKAEIVKSDMQVSLDRVVVPVGFDVTGPNPTLEGTMAFSVCTDEACLIERKDIRLSVIGPGAGSAKPAPSTVGAAPTATAAPTGGK